MLHAVCKGKDCIVVFVVPCKGNEFIDENPTSFLFSLTCRSYYTPYCIRLFLDENLSSAQEKLIKYPRGRGKKSIKLGQTT